jgi:hypothetical protein
MARRWLLQHSTPLRVRGSKSWTMARGRPCASKRRRRMTSAIVTTTLS